MRYLLLVFSCVSALLLNDVGFCQQQSNKGIVVKGIVVDFSGRPWKDAVVKIESKKLYADRDRVQREVHTDRDGQFIFFGLPIGSYEVSLESVTPALRETKEVPTLPDGSIFEVDFGLEIGSMGECPLHFVVGKVTGANKRAIEGAKISVINAFNQRRVLSAKTDKSGNYQIPICNPGQYIVFVSTTLYEVQANVVTFMPKEFSKNVDFQLVRLQGE